MLANLRELETPSNFTDVKFASFTIRNAVHNDGGDAWEIVPNIYLDSKIGVLHGYKTNTCTNGHESKKIKYPLVRVHFV